MRLSASTAYYIRKLLRQRSHQLKFVALPGAALRADPLADLDQVIASLYLQDAEVVTVIENLEALVTSHRSLTSRFSIHETELAELERRIFWLLGFKCP
ncbi:MAG TPA: hypothetical protein V6C78_05740 [Crinalium sp.]|jgi:hypothetical protein